jgi:hypothetical protein
MSTELTEAERAAEQVLTNMLPHCVGLVNDALAQQIVAAVRPIIEAIALRDLAETLDKLPAAYGTDHEYRSGIADAVGIARARADRRDNP